MSDLIQQYDQKLKELTFNSRPIIEELTTVASENPIIADEIIELIKARIYKVIPEQKLFTLYLLDSICKTVGNPYNILIGDDVFDLYSHVFQLSNDTVRNKMVNLYNTWRETKTIGTNDALFPDQSLDKIEQFIKKAGYPKILIIPDPQQALVNDIDQIIPIFENKLRLNPEPKLQERLKAFNQLKLMLTNQVIKPAELAAVQNHINNIKSQELSNDKSPMPANMATATPPPGAATDTVTNAHLPSVPNTSGPQSLPPIPKIPKINIAVNLFNDLILSGLVKKDQDPIPGSKPSYTLVFPESKYTPITTNEDVTMDSIEDILLASSGVPRSEYEKLKFNEIVMVAKKTKTNESLQNFIISNKPSSQVVDLLYEDKAKKCPTCGKRFTDDTDGMLRHRLHLDWHFRINKKLSSKGGNIQSRNWYLDDYDWVQFKDEELSEFSTTTTTVNQTTTTDVDNSTTTPDLGSTYVVVPPNDTNMINRCVICREQVKATYNDEIGEWCWMDCIKQPGESKNGRKIVHIACYHESSKKRAAEEELNPNFKREKV